MLWGARAVVEVVDMLAAAAAAVAAVDFFVIVSACRCVCFTVVVVMVAVACLRYRHGHHRHLSLPFLLCFILFQHESFWVNHYASKVLYTVEGWVERNMDSVPQSFSDTMLSSQHTVSPLPSPSPLPLLSLPPYPPLRLVNLNPRGRQPSSNEKWNTLNLRDFFLPFFYFVFSSLVSFFTALECVCR